MAELIPSPDLDVRDEELLAAQAIARVAGGLTVERIDGQIETLRKLRAMVESGTLAPAVCPELTNTNPSAPHTVLLETQGWLLAQVARRINQLPVRDQIEFARMFGITLRDATAATTTLRFTVAAPLNTDVTIPAGTRVKDADGLITFETSAELVIPFGDVTGDVAAICTETGAQLLAPGVLTVLVDPIAFVESVTNLAPVDSGSDAETVEEALERARNYQRRGERLVSALDIEDAVLEEVLQGSGIVRAFPFVASGNFAERKPGHTTLVVMTNAGNAVSDEKKEAIRVLLEQAVGNQFIYLIDPNFIDFNVTATLKLSGLISQTATLAGVESNLRNFYAARAGNFGRQISRSEIIYVIEGSNGVTRIASDADGPILTSPAADIEVAPYELPRLVNVTLNVA